MHIIVQLVLCLGLLRLRTATATAGTVGARRLRPEPPSCPSGAPGTAGVVRWPARRVLGSGPSSEARWWPLCGPPVHPPTMAQTVADLDFDPIALLEQELGSNDRSARLRAVKGLPALATACGVEVTRTKILSILAEHVRQEEEDEVQYRIAMVRGPLKRAPPRRARARARGAADLPYFFVFRLGARRPRVDFDFVARLLCSSWASSTRSWGGTGTGTCSSTPCRTWRASRRRWCGSRRSRRSQRSSRAST